MTNDRKRRRRMENIRKRRTEKLSYMMNILGKAVELYLCSVPDLL